MKFYNQDLEDLRDNVADVVATLREEGVDDAADDLEAYITTNAKNPWEAKPLHQLSPSEQLSLLSVAEASNFFDREKRIKDSTEQALKRYFYNNEASLNLNAVSFHMPAESVRPTLAAGFPPATSTYEPYLFHLPCGLKTHEARWLIERQIREHLDVQH